MYILSKLSVWHGGEARTENKVLASRSKKTRSPSHCQYNIFLLTCYNNTGIEGSGSKQTTRSHSLEPIRRVAEDAVEGRGRNVHLAAVPGRPPAPRSEPIRPKMYEIFSISKLYILQLLCGPTCRAGCPRTPWWPR